MRPTSRRTLLRGLAAGATASADYLPSSGPDGGPGSTGRLGAPREWLFDPVETGIDGGRLTFSYVRQPDGLGVLGDVDADAAAWVSVADLTLSLVSGDLDPGTVSAAVTGDGDARRAAGGFVVGEDADRQRAVAAREDLAVVAAGRTVDATTAATGAARAVAERDGSLRGRRPAGTTVFKTSSVSDPVWATGRFGDGDERLPAVAAAIPTDDPAHVEKVFVFRDGRTRRGSDPVRVANRTGIDLMAPVSEHVTNAPSVWRQGRVVTATAPVERVPESGFI